MGKVSIVGMGTGSEDYLLPIAKKTIQKAKTVFGFSRMIELSNRRDGICFKNIAEGIKQIEQAQKQGTVAVLVSGDPLIYSLTKSIQNDPRSRNWEIEIIPGISSLQMLGAKLGIPMDEVKITSIHGRAVNKGKLAAQIAQNQYNFFLCSKEQGAVYLAEICEEYRFCDVQIGVGSELSYESEQIIIGTPEEIKQREYQGLCVAVVINKMARKPKITAFIQDEDFLRDNIPMTKEEVRMIAIQNMFLDESSVVWDIGAGTGSVSVECARRCSFGTVYAVEYKKEAIALTQRNAEWFGCDNLNVIEGKAPEVLKELPDPDSVFVGGSNGCLVGIIEELKKRKNPIRFVMSAVTMETLAEAIDILKGESVSIIQVQIQKSKKLASYHIMQPQNTVTLLIADFIEGKII